MLATEAITRLMSTCNTWKTVFIFVSSTPPQWLVHKRNPTYQCWHSMLLRAVSFSCQYDIFSKAWSDNLHNNQAIHPDTEVSHVSDYQLVSFQLVADHNYCWCLLRSTAPPMSSRSSQSDASDNSINHDNALWSIVMSICEDISACHLHWKTQKTIFFFFSVVWGSLRGHDADF